MKPSAALLVVAAVCMTGCATNNLERTIEHAVRAPSDLICPDGAPVLIFLDPSCRHGVCGFTCAPTRWEKKADAKAAPCR